MQNQNSFYDLYVVRTKGYKSILYRFLTNSFWNMLVFKTKYDFFIVLSSKGLEYLYEKDFHEKYKVIEMRRCPSYFIYEPVALDRLKEHRMIRKCEYQNIKYFINAIFNFLGRIIGIKRLQNFRFKSAETYTNDVGFVIRMFGLKESISEFSKDVKFFHSNDIYKFLNIDGSELGNDFKENFMRL